ncbi:MAG: hypothetical protein V7750_12515 [Sneathiella sp.]
MTELPSLRITCSRVETPENIEIAELFTLSGFSILSHEYFQDKSKFLVARCRPLDDASFFKLFRQLYRKFGVTKISFSASSAQKFEDFFRNIDRLGSGSSTRSYLFRNGSIVEKHFIKADLYFENEIEARDLLKPLSAITPIIDKGARWFSMPYIPDENPYFKSAFPRRFPIEIFDKIYAFVEEVYAKGYCLVDWNLESFRYNNNAIKMVDFEYLYKHSSSAKFTISPDVTGVGQERKTAAGDIVTFDNHWRQILGFSLADYHKMSHNKLRVKQMRHLVLNQFPAYLFQPLKGAMKKVKNMIRFKKSITGDTITISKRF